MVAREIKCHYYLEADQGSGAWYPTGKGYEWLIWQEWNGLLRRGIELFAAIPRQVFYDAFFLIEIISISHQQHTLLMSSLPWIVSEHLVHWRKRCLDNLWNSPCCPKRAHWSCPFLPRRCRNGHWVHSNDQADLSCKIARAIFRVE